MKFIKVLLSINYTRILIASVLLLLFAFILPHFLKHIHATGITVSNVTFDPSTGAIAFDYSGDTLNGNQSIFIYDTSGTTLYWDSSKGHCSSSHCAGSVVVSTNSDSGVTSVAIQIGTDLSQSLNYPLPLPTTNAPQTPSAVGGWTSTGDTWTYVSSNSFKISGVDRTATYTQGARIKCTNNGSTYYGTVENSTFSTDTTVSLIPNSDYSLSNSSITAPFYSYEESPEGYPGFFDYTPTATGFSSYTAEGQYYVTGNMITLQYLVFGTSNATTFTISTPIGGHFNTVDSIFTSARARDNGNLNADPAAVYMDATSLRLFKDFNETPWTASGTKSAGFTITYRFN